MRTSVPRTMRTGLGAQPLAQTPLAAALTMRPAPRGRLRP